MGPLFIYAEGSRLISFKVGIHRCQIKVRGHSVFKTNKGV